MFSESKSIDPKALRMKRDGEYALLQFSSAWADGHPRTVHLLGEEADVWSRQGPLRLVLPH